MDQNVEVDKARRQNRERKIMIEIEDLREIVEQPTAPEGNKAVALPPTGYTCSTSGHGW